jgi:ribosomal silencing factor RsfS
MCCPFTVGCDSSDGSTPYANTGTSWDNTINGVYEVALDKDTYPYADSIYIDVDESNRLVDYTVIVADDTTEEQAVAYANDLIDAFNDIAAEKKDGITPSSDGYYGSVFDEYKIIMTIATNESIMNESDWLVCQTIAAGEHTPIQAGGFSNNAASDGDSDSEAE